MNVFISKLSIPMGTNCVPLLANLFFFRMKQNSLKSRKMVIVFIASIPFNMK